MPGRIAARVLRLKLACSRASSASLLSLCLVLLTRQLIDASLNPIVFGLWRFLRLLDDFSGLLCARLRDDFSGLLRLFQLRRRDGFLQIVFFSLHG
jgi:hypothetical protein